MNYTVLPLKKYLGNCRTPNRSSFDLKANVGAVNACMVTLLLDLQYVKTAILNQLTLLPKLKC